jgi:hypothetical protein
VKFDVSDILLEPATLNIDEATGIYGIHPQASYKLKIISGYTLKLLFGYSFERKELYAE